MLPVKPVYETIGKIGPARLRHRVVPAGMKRVALEESPDGEPGAAEDAVPGIASIAYSEQVGTNRQRFGRSGETNRR